jgi:hypothetical protein
MSKSPTISRTSSMIGAPTFAATRRSDDLGVSNAVAALGHLKFLLPGSHFLVFKPSALTAHLAEAIGNPAD